MIVRVIPAACDSVLPDVAVTVICKVLIFRELVIPSAQPLSILLARSISAKAKAA